MFTRHQLVGGLFPGEISFQVKIFGMVIKVIQFLCHFGSASSTQFPCWVLAKPSYFLSLQKPYTSTLGITSKQLLLPTTVLKLVGFFLTFQRCLSTHNYRRQPHPTGLHNSRHRWNGIHPLTQTNQQTKTVLAIRLSCLFLMSCVAPQILTVWFGDQSDVIHDILFQENGYATMSCNVM